MTPEVQGWVIILLIGGIAGWLAGVVVRGFGFGILGNIVVGIVGAFLGSWLFPRLGLNLHFGGGMGGAILFAFLGAVVLLLLIRLIKRA
ncbi:MAG: GlsB/YeaQ/YmgE family stress response membrane protein [Lysobacteraceae bacterium]